MDASTSPADFDFAAVFAALPAPTAVFAADPPRFTILAVSDAFLTATQRARETVVGRALAAVMQDAEVQASLTAAVQTGATQHMHRVLGAAGWDAVNTPVSGPDGTVRYVVLTSADAGSPQMADGDGRLRLLASRNPTRERADWLKDQGDALMAAVNGAPLLSSLGVLVRTAPETLGAGVRAAFYLAGPDGTALHHLVGMSNEYAQAVDGFAIGPESLACGLAAHSGEPVLTVDVQADPRWERWRWMAERFGYRGCWSFPIHSTAGKLVGTLALYWPQPRAASARELELASLLTNTAAIIISRHREAEVRQQVEDALRAALAEREALLRELHHRVKNNLQVITSLLEMQARKVHDSPALSLLTEARNRISAIGAIHELLYQSKSLSSVDLLRYAERLIPHIVALYERSATIRIAVLGDEVAVDLARAVPIGLLLNELVSNVCKHAFPASAAGELTVTWQQNDERVHLRVTDTGIGLPAGFSARESATLGLQLVHMLAKQLGGTVAVCSTGGTTVDVHLPK